MMIEEDYFLLRKLCEGDMSAILKNEADAEDLVQEIFLKIWENRETVSRAASFRSYLYSMTRNTVYNKLKHDRVHERYKTFARHRPAVCEPEERILTKDLLSHINAEMEKLTKQQRTIYEMSHEGDLSYDEISRQLDISPKTVQYHISSVLAKLRKLL